MFVRNRGEQWLARREERRRGRRSDGGRRRERIGCEGGQMRMGEEFQVFLRRMENVASSE